MRFSSPTGDFVELQLDGYEFGPPSRRTADGGDADWLFVRGRAKRSGESWDFRDPALTTWEARALHTWLRGIPDSTTTSIAFTEPNIAFRADSTSGGAATIVVTLSGEAAPPSLSDDDRWDIGCPMTFQVSTKSLAAAADDWERDLAAHPERGIGEIKPQARVLATDRGIDSEAPRLF